MLKTARFLATVMLGGLFTVQCANASEDDENAGICAGYLTLLKRNSAIQLALNSADNQQRAINHAMQWMRGVQRSGNGQAAAYEGERACRKIGIRPGDHR